MGASREGLLRSLADQRRRLADSVVLTPVDSLPLALPDRVHTGFLHGLYLTDKARDREAQKGALVQFAGRLEAARDIGDIHRLLADALGAATGSLRLLSGLQAHAATFMSIAAIGDRVMLLPEAGGGHFSTKAILERLGLVVTEMALDEQRLCVDRSATLAAIERDPPDFVFVDRSEGLRYEDMSFLGDLSGVTSVFDASQYLAQILTGVYPNPLDWGFDLMLFTLHKSFPGPQKAGIVGARRGEVWDRLMSGLSTLVSSSHAESTYLVGLTLLDRDRLSSYTERMLATAVALEEGLAARGVPVVDRRTQGSPDWAATQHVWIRSETADAAFDLYESLAGAGVLTNYRKLPYGLGYGIRMGTTFSAVAGIGVPEADDVAEVIALVASGADPQPLARRVADIARRGREQALVPPEHWA